MEDTLAIACFVVALVALAVLSFWFAPDEHPPVDPWTTPWAA